MQKWKVPVGKRQGTDLGAVIPWIVSDHMLPSWSRQFPDAPAVKPDLTAEVFATVLESRGSGFRWAGREALYTKKNPQIRLECKQKQAYLLPLGNAAWHQLLDDCCVDWTKVCRHAGIPGDPFPPCRFLPLIPIS